MKKQSIHIHGILRRSGTNFLNQLLLLHPEVKQPSIKIRENWFLEYISYLEDYITRLDSHWKNSKWKGDDYSLSHLKKAFGQTFINYMKNNDDISSFHLLTKTPSFKNLNKFKSYFSDSKLLLVVRNPFDVAASTHKTWQTPIKKTLNQWQESVLEAYRLEQNHQAFIVRYEDLIANPKLEIEKCLSYLEVDLATYSWGKIDELPIFGSSDQGGKWEVTQKSSDFKSVNKWAKLPEHLLDEMESNNREAINAYFGYDMYFNSKELKSLPSYETRLKIGAEFITTAFNTPKEDSNRLSDMKKGLKLIYKALKP